MGRVRLDVLPSALAPGGGPCPACSPPSGTTDRQGSLPRPAVPPAGGLGDGCVPAQRPTVRAGTMPGPCGLDLGLQRMQPPLVPCPGRPVGHSCRAPPSSAERLDPWGISGARAPSLGPALAPWLECEGSVRHRHGTEALVWAPHQAQRSQSSGLPAAPPSPCPRGAAGWASATEGAAHPAPAPDQARHRRLAGGTQSPSQAARPTGAR